MGSSKYSLILLFVVCSNFGLPLLAQAPQLDICLKANEILKVIEDNHFDPRDRNIDWSNNVFDIWFEQMDPNKIIFTNSDIDNWSDLRNSIHEKLEAQECSFIAEIAKVYKSQYEYMFRLNNDLDLSSLLINKEEIAFVRDSRISSNDEIKQSWRKYLKHELLSNLIDAHPDAEGLRAIKTKEIEDQFDRLIFQHNCRFASKINESIDHYQNVGETFLKALGLAYDPHTSYLDTEESMEFLSGLYQATMGYGFTIEQNDKEEIIIDRLLPGGSAWAKDQISKGDIITKIITEKGKTIDLTCLQVNEVMDWLHNSQNNSATFYFKHVNGKEGNYKLKKNYEGYDFSNEIVSMLLKDDDHIIAYSAIPSFYTEDEMGNGTANDLAKQLLLITQKDKLDGMIIDLRFNGGGYILEALRMAGMFVNYGTLGVAHYKDGVPEILKDPDRGILYNGPLVILVNGASASASELFSSALQDFNRAVIVGDTTYGKGTIQTLLPLSSTRASEEIDHEMTEMINMTIGRFYRPNQHSVQRVGVIPDIVLPDILDNYQIGERYQPAALEDEKIDKKTYYKKLTELPVDRLREKSYDRIKESTFFQMIASLANEKQLDAELSWNGVRAMNKKRESRVNVAKMSGITSYYVDAPEYLTGNDISTYRSEYLTETKKQITDDAYINECWHIVKDLTQIKD